MRTTANPERCSVAPGSARMTLMRGTPEEIERDLAAIDTKIADLTKQRDEWREKHWNAHHHAHAMFLDVVRLRTALQAIADEANQHHEHNPISGKDRLPRGYINILNLADAALNPPNVRDQPRSP